MKILMAVIVIAFIAFFIWVYATYGGKPITEIPSWAAGIIMGGK